MAPNLLGQYLLLRLINNLVSIQPHLVHVPFILKDSLASKRDHDSAVELTPCNIVKSGSAPKDMRQGYAPRLQFPKESSPFLVVALFARYRPRRKKKHQYRTVSMVWSRALFARQNNGGSAVPAVCFGPCSTSRKMLSSNRI